MSEKQKKLAWSKLKVGLVVAAALLVLFLAVLFAGSIENIFSPKVTLKAQIENANGLRAGAPVWLYGIEVGSVSDIRLEGAHETSVTLSVGKRYLGFIRKDARISVLTMGLLGDKYVDLAAGSPEAPPIGPGDVIQGAVRRDLATAGAESMAKITEVIARLERLFAKIEGGEGTLAKLINDPSLYNNLNGATQNLAKVTRDMTNREGTVSKLINDPSLYDNLRDSTQNLAQVSRELMNEEGTFRMLLKKPALYENLNKASGEFSATIEKLNQADGIAGKLIADKDLAADIKETVKELNGLIKDVKEHPDRYFKVSVF
jgi:phospholipid/cholesterol/gamma-HCH transport system substrate-binding protein